MWSLLLAPILILSLSFSVAAFTKHTRILSQQVRLLQPRISKWTRVNAAPVAIQNEAKSEIVSPESVQNHIEQIVNVTLLNDELLLHSLRWKPGALELYLFKSGLAEDVSPDLEKLEHFHRHLYTELELIPEISSFLEKCDIVISSPGLSDILSSDKDFVTFQVTNCYHNCS